VNTPIPVVSRRAAVVRLGAAGLGLAIAVRVPAAAAQDASPAVPPAGIPPILAEWAAAWTARDADRLVALYAPDAVYEEVPTGTVARGHGEIRAFFDATHASFADIAATPRSGFRAEGWAVLEGDFSGRSGEATFSVPFAAIFELDGGLVRRSADYFDLYAVLDQIGALGAQAAAATPTA
jgi:steroid delta-isomerase-like uncharacterized protein